MSNEEKLELSNYMKEKLKGLSFSEISKFILEFRDQCKENCKLN